MSATMQPDEFRAFAFLRKVHKALLDMNML